ncbi:hypothetical protein C2845_PM16G20730 [Panicum miliaceum]|uniref:SUI1 domain-containing protein n=1 Tax=Panicum miliaceum TaxID=4540 RepID=A0A3L6PYP3_PANMI|nr:hypothetical protein C2845_PM16G20730 [Panicum miliaceum]
MEPAHGTASSPTRTPLPFPGSATAPPESPEPRRKPPPCRRRRSSWRPPATWRRPTTRPPSRWRGGGLASYSDEDEDEVKAKPAAPKKGKSTGKARAPSKDKYLLPAAKKPAGQQDQKAKSEPEDQFMPGPVAGFGELLSSFDPFADAERADEDDAPAAPRDGGVHLRVQQRNGRKQLTTVQGLSAAYIYAKILRDLKRDLCCSGIVVEDEELGSVIQLQGDHRKAVAGFLVKAGMVSKPNVKIHGA